MIRPSAIATQPAVEAALDVALRELRKLDQVAPTNLLARASIEYRIGALRRRKAALAGCALAAFLLAGCASVPPNRLAHYPEADVLFASATEVNRLCQSAPNARRDGVYLGCYFPGLRLAIVPHGAAATLAHELRHAREGRFHP
jgi:hypothetical protein